MSLHRLEEKIQRLRETQKENEQMLTILNSSNIKLETIVSGVQSAFKKQFRGELKSKEKPKGLS